MTRLTDEALRLLARELADRISREAPDWTGKPEDDPGVTILEVLAFLTEQLVYRKEPLRGKGSALAGRIVEGLERLRMPRCEAFDGVMRVRYFDGQVLTAEDLVAEQTYHRTRSRRHNRCLHGSGIVEGLEVTVGPNGPAGEPEVQIHPGCAIAPDGEELVVREPRTCRFPASGASGVVGLRFAERGVRPVPTTVSGGVEATRIEEGVAVAFTSSPPEDAVAIARLEFVDSSWRVDPGFDPERAR